MSGQLPAQIDPIRLADEGARLLGTLPGSGMPRLREFLLPGCHPSEVTVDLQFERTAQGVRLMHGSIRTHAEVVCQRCLKPLTIEVVAKPFVALLQASEDEPEEGEALVVEAPLPLAVLIEDELLLAMPMNPAHAEGECDVSPVATGKAPVPGKKESPFAELRGFKGKSQ